MNLFRPGCRSRPRWEMHGIPLINASLWETKLQHYSVWKLWRNLKELPDSPVQSSPAAAATELYIRQCIITHTHAHIQTVGRCSTHMHSSVRRNRWSEETTSVCLLYQQQIKSGRIRDIRSINVTFSVSVTLSVALFQWLYVSNSVSMILCQ